MGSFDMKSKFGIKLSTYIVCGILSIFFIGTLLVIVKNTINGKNKAIARRDGDRIYQATSFINDIWKNNNIKQSLWSNIDSYLTYMIDGQISSEQVVLGENGWLFSKAKNDSDPIADYEGTNKYTDGDVEDCIESLDCLDSYCRENDSVYSVVFVPNKESLYYEYMPASYKMALQSRTDILADSLLQNGYNVVNLRECLSEAKEIGPLYYQYDTHWNQVGAYIGTEKILRTFGVSTEPIDSFHISSHLLSELGYHDGAKDDLAGMIGMRDDVFDDEEEKIIDELPVIDWEEYERQVDSSSIVCVKNENAVNKATVLLLDFFQKCYGSKFKLLFHGSICVHNKWDKM